VPTDSESEAGAGLRVTRRLVAVVLAYCHLAATSAGNLPLSSPVGFAMEATATGTPGLPGRTGLTAAACRSLPLALATGSDSPASESESRGLKSQSESQTPPSLQGRCRSGGPRRVGSGAPRAA
jgi:hypothetical protein